MREVWQYREEFAKGSFRQIVDLKEIQRESQQRRAERREEGEGGGDATKTAFTASVAAVVIGALVLRLGGRAALVSALGLDVVADLGIGDKIDQVLAYADAAPDFTLVAFIGGWIVSKVFLIDIIAIGLAFSSGILFGGVVQGALISGVGATLGSLTAFGLSRTLLQEKVEEKIANQPIARGLTKVVEEDGFKTVFVLRLSPVLPIPAGSYPYIYGTSKLNPLTFAAGYFLGSMKPYLLDAYLGIFSKQVIDGATLDESKDLILLVGLGALVLVGAFATELANESWDLVQEEVRADKQRQAEEKEAALREGRDLEAEAEAAKEEWDGMLGPINATAIRASAAGAIPSAVREESGEVWTTLSAYIDEQWNPSLREAVTERREEDARQERTKKMMEDMRSGRNIPREAFLAATERPKRDDTPSPADLAGRARMAEWSLDGPPGPWRETLSAIYFSIALASSARRQWIAYPDTDEQLEARLSLAVADQMARDQAAASTSTTSTSSTTAAPTSTTAASASTPTSAASMRAAAPADEAPSSSSSSSGGGRNDLLWPDKGVADIAALNALEEALAAPSAQPAEQSAAAAAAPTPSAPADAAATGDAATGGAVASDAVVSEKESEAQRQAAIRKRQAEIKEALARNRQAQAEINEQLRGRE